MEIKNIATNIVKIIKEKYNTLVKGECMDLLQIINICTLYKTKKIDHKVPSGHTPTSASTPASTSASGSTRLTRQITLHDIHIGSPKFEKVNPKTNKKKKQEEILHSEEFRKKYDFFVRIIFSCLEMDIEIFDMSDEFATLKNNYKLTKSMEYRKKKLIEEHYLILKEQYKYMNKKLDDNYEAYVSEYILKIKIIDKMIGSIDSLIQSKVFERTDNLFSLIIPYFYTYVSIIEEYN